MRVSLRCLKQCRLLLLLQPVIEAALLHQLVVRAVLGDSLVGDKEDIVGLLDGREAVRHHKGCPAL